MRIYTVHVKEADRREPDDLKAVAVREAFSVWAFLFRWLWAAGNGAWIVAAILLAIEIGLAVSMVAVGFGGPPATLLGLVWMVAVGLFGRDLKRWELGILGYEMEGAVVAEDGDDALRRYFADTTRDRDARHAAARASPVFREDVVAPSIPTPSIAAPSIATPSTPTPAVPAAPRMTAPPGGYDTDNGATVPRAGPRLT